MNILILGSGGREHALGWKLAQSKDCQKLFIAPGNAGTASVGENVKLELLDFDAIAEFVLVQKIELIVVGPEAPLVQGFTDYFRSKRGLQDILIIGPSKAAAALEGSKDFAKRFMKRHAIPTAGYETFTKSTLAEAKAYLRSIKPPYVLKADGLAGGKGVVILATVEEADRELDAMLDKSKFGAASETVVIEDFLDGIELSVFALTDGKSYVLLPSAKDYKRIGDGDKGLNTGGMGAVSPVPFADEAFMKKVEERIVKPTIAGFEKDKLDYIGFVFFGLMKVGDDPYVIEYNVRLGDPETEAVLPRIDSDLLKLLQAAANGNLKDFQLKIADDYATTIVLVSGGYPEAYEKGKTISGLDTATEATVFHSGTAMSGGRVVSSGGRVLAITGRGESLQGALKVAYSAADKIDFKGKYNRSDIGFDLD